MKLHPVWARRRPLLRALGWRGRPGGRRFGNRRRLQAFGDELGVNRLHDDGNEARVEVAPVLKCLRERGGVAVRPRPADYLHGIQYVTVSCEAKINDNAREKLVLARQAVTLETQLPRQGATSQLPMGAT